MEGANNGRVKFGYYCAGLNDNAQNKKAILNGSRKVTPKEYVESMRGGIYCPACYEKLTRVPKFKDEFTNGRKACFSHLPSTRNTPCDLRSTKPVGHKYDSQEEVMRAIADQNLVVVSAFMDEPQLPENGNGEYNQSQVENVNGPVALTPISRHTGKSFTLPTKITSVESLCRLFDINLYRHFVFPNNNSAYRLVDTLIDIRTVKKIDSVPRLYFGKIIRSFNAGNNPKPTNIRMTKLECHPDVVDFYIKVVDSMQVEKGITDHSVNRYVIFWAEIRGSGAGLAAARLKWGEFALLPKKYEELLPK